MQFIELGVYRRNEEISPYGVVYDVIIDGEVVGTFTKKNTAIIELAAQIDKKIKREVNRD